MRVPLTRPTAPFARTLAAAAIVLLAHAGSALAAPPPPTGLEVVGGDQWRADRHFELRWANPAYLGAPLAAVHYLVRDPGGAIAIGPERIGWPVQRADRIALDRGPGAYTAEVWLEDSLGAQGAAAEAKLRFDDAAPGRAEPLHEPRWIGAAALPYVAQIGHPAGESPLSGIRGYAVSIDRDSEESPCAAAESCTEAETDLRGGAGDDSLLVPELPEGISYVHAVAVSGSGLRSPLPGHAALRVDRTDPVTHLAGVPAGWANRSVVLRATATDDASGMSPGGGASPFTAVRVDGGPPTIVAGDSAGAVVIGDGVHTVAHYARDAAGNVDDGGISNGHRNAPPPVALVRIDREPPHVLMVGSRGPDDPELIEARVSDNLSGPSRARGTIAMRAVGSDRPFEALPTAVLGAVLRARWDSDRYPAGEYEFRATGFDAAGNSATGGRRPNGAPLVLPSPLKVASTLSADLGGEGGGGRLVANGRGAMLSGRLALASGAPAEGFAVRIVERFEPGAASVERTTEIRTGEEGRYALRLQPGPSRDVVAEFAGTRAVARTASPPARLAVRSGVRLRASAPSAAVGGRPVVFRGRLDSAPGEGPAAGVSVQLQFRLPGLPWTEFRTIQTGRGGGFRYPYRFSDDDSRGVRFLFRAFAPTQSDWPYEPGGSRPVAVRGA